MESVLGLVRHPGNDALFRAIEMSLLATLAGQPFHVHAEGLRGTGKTTIMRAVRRVLPRIRRIKGCLFNCDPASPHCPAHKGLDGSQVAELGEEWVPMPFLEISHSAKIGTVVGSIDLARLVSPTGAEAALLPGTIPQAHRGIIFVDEINRLAETSPELADVLLDVMGTKPGRVQIEETGLRPMELPVQVSVWAASNPDEDPGPLEEIRRQLSDRFDFALYTDRPTDADVVERILAMAERAEGISAATAQGQATAQSQAQAWQARLEGRVAEFRRVALPSPLRQRIADLYSRFDLESLRAVQAIQSGVRLAACLDNRHEPHLDDLQTIVPLALRHRVDPETVRKVVAALASGERPEGASAARSRFPGLSFGGVVAEAAQAERTGSSAGSGAPGGENPGRESSGRESTGQESTGRESSGREIVGSSHSSHVVAQAGGDAPSTTGASASDGESWLRRTLSQLGLRRQQEQSGGARQGLDRVGRGTDRSGVLSAYRTAQSGGEMRLPNPVEHPPEAPPNKARPLSALPPDLWVRTEEELGQS